VSYISYPPIHKEQSFLFAFLTCGLARKKKYKFCLHVMRLSARALGLELWALRVCISASASACGLTLFLLRVQASACGLALFITCGLTLFLFFKTRRACGLMRLRPYARDCLGSGGWSGLDPGVYGFILGRSPWSLCSRQKKGSSRPPQLFR